MRMRINLLRQALFGPSLLSREVSYGVLAHERPGVISRMLADLGGLSTVYY